VWIGECWSDGVQVVEGTKCGDECYVVILFSDLYFGYPCREMYRIRVHVMLENDACLEVASPAPFISQQVISYHALQPQNTHPLSFPFRCCKDAAYTIGPLICPQ